MSEIFSRWSNEGLVWLPERGMGFFPVTDAPYDEAYFEKYVEMAQTEQGRAITEARKHLVLKHVRYDNFVDVGIGCGVFIEALRPHNPRTFGYDINPAGIAWLRERKLWRDPRVDSTRSLSFWDVFEHIPDFGSFLDACQEWVFMSLPIFMGPEHILHSRHFRKDEHMWYWTRQGLIDTLDFHGFTCVEHNTMESLLDREDIHTFVFRRVEPPALAAISQADGHV